MDVIERLESFLDRFFAKAKEIVIDGKDGRTDWEARVIVGDEEWRVNDKERGVVKTNRRREAQL